MPIISQPVTQDDIDSWLRNTNAPPPFIHQVSRWPKHITARTNCAYRLKYIKDGAFCPMRWFGHWNTTDFAAPETVDGWFDVTPDGPGRLIGSTGFGPSGYSVDVIIQSNEANPMTGNPGISMEQRVVRQATGGYFFNRFAYDWGTSTAFECPLNQLLSGFTSHEDGFIGDFGWSNNNSYVASVGSCYEFVKVSPPPVEDFARFNGVDAYIKLTPSTPVIGGTWIIQADVFARSANLLWLASSSINATSYVGINVGLAHWGNNVFPLSIPVPINQWSFIRFSHQWFSGGNITRCWIDGQLAGSEAQGNPTKQFDILGARLLFSPQLFGDFDMQHLLMLLGPTSSPQRVLDMPLHDDACSIDPLNIKGTTFNMQLPSCS